jgi:excinuclease ABC subunit C
MDGASARQLFLLRFENPLVRNLGRDFFRSLPREPGVYRMYDARGQLLYVGKAKDLRARLGSYRHVHADRDSRKLLRLVYLVRSIQWETCADETQALLLENSWLREHKPPFNVANTTPESYFFIGLREDSDSVRLRITTKDESAEEGEVLHGAFKSRKTLRKGYAAVLRLLWCATDTGGERFEIPARLLRRHPPSPRAAAVPRDCIGPLKKFLGGSSNALLGLLCEKILAHGRVPPWQRTLVQEDLEAAREFYERCARRNRRLRRRYPEHARDGRIPQRNLDDLFVLERGGGPSHREPA